MAIRTVLPLLVACGGARPVAGPLPPLVGSGSAVVAAIAPPAPSHATRVRAAFGITEYHLDNGLQILLMPDATQSTVTVNITYLVGSRLEGYGETGMAHLLEHMMFKGSPRHRNVLALLEDKGGETNGSTSYDRTNYYETLPASQDNLDWVLDLEADRMTHAEVSAEDLKTEFSVVRNELEGGENDPAAILEERILETAYLWHNYGKPTIGSRSDIERVPVSALRAFYDKYYQPDDAVLIVSGKFDDAAALGSIEKTFGAIPKPTRVLADSHTIEPVQDGERSVTLRRTGDVTVLGVGYHGVAGASADFPALEAAVDVLTHEPSGRLYKQLVEPALVASVTGDAAPQRDPFVAVFLAQVRDPKLADKAEQILVTAIESLGGSRIDDKEIERWRTQAEKELDLAMANSQQLAIELSEFAALGDWRTLFAYRDQIKKVTAADVQRVAKLYFMRSNRTLGRFIPTKEPELDRAPLTQTPDVAAYVQHVQGDNVQDPGEVFAATLDNIEAHTTRATLASGISAALLPKKTRGGKVRFSLRLHWGDERSLQGMSTAASLVGPMMLRGSTKHSFQDVADLEDQLQAHLAITSTAEGMTIEIETVRDKLAAAIDLVAELATSPSFPDKQLAIVRQQQLATLEQQLQEPAANALAKLDQLVTKWPKTDPRYTESIADEIDQLRRVKLAEIKQFYKKFAGAGHGELVVVGDFDVAAIPAQVDKRFASWQTKQPYTRLPAKAFGVAGQTAAIDLRDKAQSTIAWAYDLPMRDTHADYPGLLVALQLLGGDSASRLWMRLREHEGLSYGVGTYVTADPFDDAATVLGYAVVAPENVSKAKASILDEIGKLASSGTALAAELQRAKDAYIKDQDTQLSDDGYVVTLLANQLFRGRTIAELKDLRAKIEATTLADLARIATRYLDPKRLTMVVAGDASKTKWTLPSRGWPS